MQDAGTALLGVTHILVVDDDDRLRKLLKGFLIKHGFRVSAVESAKAAREILTSFAFDILVIDIMMPEEDGISLLSALRKISQVPILLLTAMSETDHRIRGLEQGADDYLTKPFEPKELLLRIEAILRRTRQFLPKETPSSIDFSHFILDMAQGQIHSKNNQEIHLTGSELSLLIELAKQAGQVISRAELAYRAKIQGGDRAVDVQIARLRGKLEANPKAPRHLCTMHGQGYVFRL